MPPGAQPLTEPLLVLLEVRRAVQARLPTCVRAVHNIGRFELGDVLAPARTFIVDQVNSEIVNETGLVPLPFRGDELRIECRSLKAAV